MSKEGLHEGCLDRDPTGGIRPESKELLRRVITEMCRVPSEVLPAGVSAEAWNLVIRMGWGGIPR